MKIALEVEACETGSLPASNATVQWWVVGKSQMSSKCPIVHVQGKEHNVLAFLREHWGPIEDWGRKDEQEFIEDFSVPYIPEGETVARNLPPAGELKEYDITTAPGGAGIEGTVLAVNPLDALDRYAMQVGFSAYSDLGPLYEWVGIDQHGMWGIFTNYTIWAIPREEPGRLDEERIAQFIADLLSHDNDILSGLTGAPPSLINAARASMDVEPSRANDRDGDLRYLRHEGLFVGVCRDRDNGKLHVTITSDGVPEIDKDEEGDPFIEVVLNDKTIVDWAPREGSRDGG
jgi:hypothetical protein